MVKLPDLNDPELVKVSEFLNRLTETKEGREAFASLLAKAMQMAVKHIKYEMSKPVEGSKE